MISPSIGTPRNVVTAAVLWLSFLLLCVFYGMPVNALVFTLAVLLLLSSALLAGPQRLTLVVLSQPRVSGVLSFFLLMLVLNYQWTISKDSSFAPAWSLALVPLVMLVARSLGRWRWRLFGGISAAVLCFALISLVLYVISGEAPAAPLSDANNYAALLYLVFIPWSYRYLLRRWQADFTAMTLMGALTGLGLLLMVIYASQSRAGLLIVCAALVVFLLLALVRRLSWKPVAELLVLALLAYGLIYLLAPFDSDFTGESLDRGMGVRLLLYEAALSIAADFPLTGSGLFTFPLLYRLIRDPLDQTTAGLSPHNDYLQLLAEGGPLMVIPVLALLAATGWLLVRSVLRRKPHAGSASPPDSSFGVLLAIGALLAHASINFVLFNPALAFLIGLLLSMVDWQTPTESDPSKVGKWVYATRGILLWGWICFGYLVLDTYTLSVFNGQPGMPFAADVREDPEKLLAYARLAESINGNRGTPVLAQAVLYQRRLEASPDSEYYRELTLSTFRRALQTDPWNPNALIAMYAFVTSRDDLQSQLEPEELPENLLVRSVILDPVFTTGYDRIIAHYERANEPMRAYAILKTQLVPWLEWLAMVDDQSALRYLDYLNRQARASGDAAFMPKLDALADIADRHEKHDRVFWWFSTGQ